MEEKVASLCDSLDLLIRTLEEKTKETVVFINAKDLLDALCPHLPKITKDMRFMLLLMEWESLRESRDEAGIIRELEHREELERQNRGKRQKAVPREESGASLSSLEQLRMAAHLHEKDGETDRIRESVINASLMEELAKNSPKENQAHLVQASGDPRLKQVLQKACGILLTIFIRNFGKLQQYWDSESLKRMLDRRRCSVAANLFIFLMHLFALSSQCMLDSLRKFVEAALGPYFQGIIREQFKLSREPIKLIAAFSRMVLVEGEYEKPEFRRATLLCFTWICRMWVLCGVGEKGYSEILSYKPLTHFMHMVVHSQKIFNSISGATCVHFEYEESGDPYGMGSRALASLFNYAKGTDFRSDRLQTFNENMFKLFLAPGDHVCQRDNTPFFTPTSVFAADEISHSPFIRMCVWICHKGLHALAFMPPLTEAEIEQGYKHPFEAFFREENVLVKVTPREIRLLMTHVFFFVIDLVVSTITMGVKTDYLEDVIYFDHDIQKLHANPGSVVILGGKHYIVANSFTKNSKDLIPTFNSPERALAILEDVLSVEETGSTYKTKLLLFLRGLKK